MSSELHIGDWQVDPALNEIRREGACVRLEPKAVEVLVYLARKPGQVVGREELLSALWPGVIVGDDALTQAIIKLRKALGDEARTPTYIETISKRGYRLIASVASGDSLRGPPGSASSSLKRRVPTIALAIVTVLALGAIVAALSPQLGRRLPWPIGKDEMAGDVSLAQPVIAVLPLANQSGDPKRDYFSDGITEDIINALGRFPGVRVISRTSVDGFKNRSAPLGTVRDELGARYVLRGSVREDGARIRVGVELSDADKGVVLWSDRYDGESRAVFEIQDKIVKNIVGALAVRVTRLEEERSASKSPQNLEAYDLVLKARELLVVPQRAENRRARELLANAIELAPAYGEAYVELGRAEQQRANYGYVEDPGDALMRSEQALRRALAIDDPGTNARAHGLLGHLYAMRGKFEQALAEADQAIALNPSDAFVHEYRGAALVYMGRVPEGVASLETAIRFNPTGNSSATRFHLALAQYVMGRYREALTITDENLARYPDTAFAHALRAAILAELGDEEGARKEAVEVRRLEPFFRVEEYGTRFVNPDDMHRLQGALRKAGL